MILLMLHFVFILNIVQIVLKFPLESVLLAAVEQYIKPMKKPNWVISLEKYRYEGKSMLVS